MPTMAWIGGRIQPFADSGVSLADRGLLFGESIYEVIPITAGRVRMLSEHVGRMQAGAAVLGIAHGVPPLPTWEARIAELVEGEEIGEGIVYAQVTGGSGPRAHVADPAPDPTFFAWVKAHAFPRADQVRRGIRVITAPDIRWARGELKTTMLLAAIMGKRQALPSGAQEVIFVADDRVREGGSTSVFIVEGGRVVGIPEGPVILPGLTARWLEVVASKISIAVSRESVTRARMLAADEVFVTATTQLAMPVVGIDGQPIGDGFGGRVTSALAEAMRTELELR